jgi:hypothetical protein
VGGWAMRDSVSTSVRWEMKWEEARQCSAKHGVTARFLVSSVDGSSAGQIVVASAWTSVPAIAQTQSREGPPREKACGLPRERTGCTEQRWSWPWYLR